MMRFLVAISHHGLGHLAQAAPVINALHARRPDLEFLIWSGLTPAALAARVHAPFVQRREAADVGLVMQDAIQVDIAESLAGYLAFHAAWERRIAREAVWLRAEKIDGVFSDVACLPLAAAARADLPGVALCSLNWVDIAGAYLQGQPGMERVLAEMAAAYQSARAFLRPTPAMPMDWLPQAEALPPIAARGELRRAELNRRLGLGREERLVLIGLGGIAHPARARLPALPGVRWLAPDGWEERQDVACLARAELPFIDLLTSVDLLVTKVGYGGFVEGAAAGLPVLYIDRPDWPETPWLAAWLRQHTRADCIPEAALFAPGIGERLEALWRRPAPPLPAADGAEAAAERVLQLLER